MSAHYDTPYFKVSRIEGLISASEATLSFFALCGAKGAFAPVPWMLGTLLIFSSAHAILHFWDVPSDYFEPRRKTPKRKFIRIVIEILAVLDILSGATVLLFYKNAGNSFGLALAAGLVSVTGWVTLYIPCGMAAWLSSPSTVSLPTLFHAHAIGRK